MTANNGPDHEQKFPVVIYANMAATVGTLHQLSMSELQELFKCQVVREDRDGKLFSLAFGRDPTFDRKLSRLIAGVSGIVIDIELDPDQAKQSTTIMDDVKRALKNHAFGIATTHGHRENRPKLRLLIPFQTPVSDEGYAKAYAGAIALLGLEHGVTPTSGDPLARFPVRSCPDAYKHIARYEWHQGDLIDANFMVDAAPADTGSLCPGSRRYREEANGTFLRIKIDWLKKVAAEWIRRGETRQAVMYALVREEDKFSFNYYVHRDNPDAPTKWILAKQLEMEVRAEINLIRTAQQQIPLSGDVIETDLLLEVDFRSDANESKPFAFAVEKIIPSGEVTLFAAHGGTGKSYLALTIAAHFACTEAWASLGMVGGKVVYVNLEDPPEILRIRLRSIVSQYKLNAALVETGLVVLDGSTGDGALVRECSQGHGRTLAATNLMKQVEEKSSGAGLIIVDNASDAFHGDENNRQLVHSFVRGHLGKLARRNNAGLLLLAHVDKQAARYDARKNSYAGSSGWHNAVRSRLTLRSDGDLVILDQEKSNFGKEIEPIAFRRMEDGLLMPVEGTATNDEEKLLADCTAIISAMRAAAADGRNVPASKTGSFVPQRALEYYSEFPSHLRKKHNRVRFWRAFSYLISTAQLSKESYKNSQSKPASRYVLAETAPYTPHTPTA